MAKTNIERFDEMSAAILAHLYESFPVHVAVTPSVAGLKELKSVGYDPATGLTQMVGEVDPEEEFFNATLRWLEHSGFVRERGVAHLSWSYVLTLQGLQALKHVPKPELGGSETLGEKLSSATKSGAKEMAKEALNQVLSIGIQALVKSSGL